MNTYNYSSVYLFGCSKYDNKAMIYLVKRNEASVVASVLKRLPSEIAQHIGHTTLW